MKIALFLLVSIYIASADIIVENQNGTVLRAYSVETFPLLHPRVVSIKGLSVDTDGDTRSIDVVQFIVSTYSNAAIYFGYYHRVADLPTNDNNVSAISSSAFAFVLETFRIFEYDNKNGQPGFQNDTADVITGAYNPYHPLLPWKEITFNSQNVTTNGITTEVHQITLETQDEVFKATLTIAGNPIKTENISITPTSMKIDYTISWFTNLHVQAEWTTGPSNAITHPNAQVGMINIVAAGFAHTVTARSKTGTVGVGLGGSGGVNAFYDWESDILVNGSLKVGGVLYYSENITIGSTHSSTDIAATWGATAVIFSFEGARPEEVFWDPQFGAEIDYDTVDQESSSTSLKPFYLVAIILMINFVL